LHGLYLVAGELTASHRQQLYKQTGLYKNPTLLKSIQWASTFGLVCVAWVFFRANTVPDGWYIITHIPAGLWESPGILQADVMQLLTILPASTFLIACLSTGFMILVELCFEKWGGMPPVTLPAPVRVIGYSAAIALILLLGSFNDTEFIYFQF
jgi:alginate O-acetyltransferase complex protein AlgI